MGVLDLFKAAYDSGAFVPARAVVLFCKSTGEVVDVFTDVDRAWAEAVRRNMTDDVFLRGYRVNCPGLSFEALELPNAR